MKKLIIATAILCVPLGLASLHNARTLSPLEQQSSFVRRTWQPDGGDQHEYFWRLEGGSDESSPRTICRSLSAPSLRTRIEVLPWQLVAEGQLAAIYAEHTLYQKEGSDRFFVHVRVQNKTRNEVGVDLGDYNEVVYPNQWGVRREAQRGTIDEKRIMPRKLDGSVSRNLLTRYVTHTLTMIKPGASADYYREFNASTIKQVESNNGKYLFVSLDGQIFDTDGKSVETITLEWGKGRDFWTDLWFTFPAQWKSIPKDGLVVGENH